MPNANYSSINWGSLDLGGNQKTPMQFGGDLQETDFGWGSSDSNMFSREGAFGESGWAMPAIQGVGAAMNAGLGIANYRLARKQLRTNKSQFNDNFNNQVRLLERDLRDRHRSRVDRGRDTGYASADDYVKSTGLKQR